MPGGIRKEVEEFAVYYDKKDIELPSRQLFCLLGTPDWPVKDSNSSLRRSRLQPSVPAQAVDGRHLLQSRPLLRTARLSLLGCGVVYGGKLDLVFGEFDASQLNICQREGIRMGCFSDMALYGQSGIGRRVIGLSPEATRRRVNSRQLYSETLDEKTPQHFLVERRYSCCVNCCPPIL